MKWTVKNIEDWKTVAKDLKARLLHPIILLKGNLGAGKTTFSQFLLTEMGSPDEVTSPTYSIVNEYSSPKGPIFHFDLYRLKNVEEVFDIGIEEYLQQAYLCIIEWPEIYEEELQGLKYHTLTIENMGNYREVFLQ